jgi:outer membrane protein OmpA-like peptidoglycan-associated protein
MNSRLQNQRRASAKGSLEPRPSILQRKCACGQHTTGGEQCEECKKKGMTLQRQSNGSAASGKVPPIVQEVLNSPGRPLESDARADMEPSFGQDFSQVRVHTDAKAAESANAVQAHAYTVGRDIVFGPGQYSSHSDASTHLLAHELTHVMQQTLNGVDADSERLANAAAARVSRGQAVDGAALGGAPVALQRSPNDDATGGTGVVASSGNSTEPPVDEFDFDKTDIPPQHLARLAELRMRLVKAPTATVTLTGHTDTVGTEKYNEGLGRRRAQAVQDFLTKDQGINPNRVLNRSKGELAPATGQPPARLDPKPGEKNPKNRRVEIEVSGLPPAGSPSSGWTFDITDPKQKPPIDLKPHLCDIYPDLCKPPDPHQIPPDFWKPLPPAPKRTQKSPLDLINENLVDPVVKAVTKGLPKAVQDKILELAHDGVEKGITSAASSAASAAGLDPKGQQAIEKAVEGAIKYKGQQPGQEGGGQ